MVDSALDHRQGEQDLTRSRQVVRPGQRAAGHHREGEPAPIPTLATFRTHPRSSRADAAKRGEAAQGEQERKDPAIDRRGDEVVRAPPGPGGRIAEGVGQDQSEEELADRGERRGWRRLRVQPLPGLAQGEEEGKDLDRREAQGGEPTADEAPPGPHPSSPAAHPSNQEVDPGEERGEDRGLRMSAQELQPARQGEGRPAAAPGGKALDREEDPGHEGVAVGHREEEEAGDHPREREGEGRHERRRPAEPQLARQEPGAAAADHDPQPGEEHEADLQRQEGEEEVERKERSPRAVAPIGAAGELVRVPVGQPAGAQLVPEEEEPGLDLVRDVAQVGVAGNSGPRVARRRIAPGSLPGRVLDERTGGARDTIG
jgi:hypothetical protein